MKYMSSILTVDMGHTDNGVPCIHRVVTNKEYQHVEATTKWPPLADNILKYIFLNKNYNILIRISLKFAHKGLIDNNSPMV